MRERPIEDLVAGLRQLGVDAECSLGTGCPPVRVAARGIAAGGRIELSGKVSSQYLTALLMAAPLAEAEGRGSDGGGAASPSSAPSSSSGCATDVVITDELISQPYVDMTIRLMTERFGALVERVEGGGATALRPHFRIPAGQRFTSPGVSFVEGDASSASYFLAGAAITGGTVRVEGCGSESLQGDVRFAEELERMGCTVRWEPTAVVVTGPSARSPGRDGRTRLRGIDADCVDIPDAAMTLAVAALFAEGTTTIRNVGSWCVVFPALRRKRPGKLEGKNSGKKKLTSLPPLYEKTQQKSKKTNNRRVKETERMKAIVAECTKLGATVVEGEDWCEITPPPTNKDGTSSLIKNVKIETYDDHRMAMAFSLVAAGGVPVTILDPGCTRKTFPTYFEELEAVSKR